MGLSVLQYFREYFHGGWRSAHLTGLVRFLEKSLNSGHSLIYEQTGKILSYDNEALALDHDEKCTMLSKDRMSDRIFPDEIWKTQGSYIVFFVNTRSCFGSKVFSYVESKSWLEVEIQRGKASLQMNAAMLC
ncbi:hypothetical protein CXB51_012871 [Gossypium anomalum]|uniref:Uncharacterized protein n=1 Tax=Gossypium anomalum TaxID=47600 RepID=A0A8J5ZQP4_9ROSI|nr:hypothetical protein CXB51_012871 [Gossypium anomalum]